MARTADTHTVVHYSIRAPLNQLYTQGRGACCDEGRVTAYAGLVTCTECKATCQKETTDDEG